MTQPSLFVAPPSAPPVTLVRQWASPDHINQLADALPWVQRTLYDTPIARLECFLAETPGAAYTYSGQTYRAQSWHDFPRLAGFAKRLRDEGHGTYNAVFANLYRDGNDSIGWHADNERALGPTHQVVIASVSLGAPRRFVVREKDHPSNRHEWELGHGDLLVMGAGCQSRWEHSVPKTKRPTWRRLNLTFRRMM